MTRAGLLRASKGFSNKFEFVTRVSHRDCGLRRLEPVDSGEDAAVVLVGDAGVSFRSGGSGGREFSDDDGATSVRASSPSSMECAQVQARRGHALDRCAGGGEASLGIENRISDRVGGGAPGVEKLELVIRRRRGSRCRQGRRDAAHLE